MKFTHILFSMAILMLAVSCSERSYLDRPTPPGNPVPPPHIMSKPVVQPIPRSIGVEASGNQPQIVEQVSQQRSADGTLDSQRIIPSKNSVSKNVPAACYRGTYVKAQKPRIAVFLNRTLSSEVRQWRTAQRHVVSGGGQVSGIVKSPGVTAEYTAGHGAVVGTPAANRTGLVGAGEQVRVSVHDSAVVGTVNATGDVSTYNQKFIEEQSRQNLEESSMWAFENGFMKPFLLQGTRLVDRATILRLTAVDNGQGSAYNPIAPKAIETKALVEHADIFIELLITENPSSNPMGYEFKAVAKEVKTGRILAMETSSVWDWNDLTSGETKVVATNSGYEVQETSMIPSISEVSGKLANDVMRALCVQWQ